MDDDDLFDVDLLELFTRGDERGFDVLYRRYAAGILRYAWALADTSQQAEELVQETFLTLWQKRTASAIYDDSLLPWLLAVCKNHWRNLRRAESRHHNLRLDSIAEQASPPDELKWVTDDLDILSPNDRRLCELCLIEGYSYQEAAAELDITTSAAGKRLERARGRLRKAVRGNGK
jgi:RNA polymerase sigma factor (sigma-70 family)